MTILVCDCGTSSCRASVVDGETGRKLTHRAIALPPEVFAEGGAEVDVDLLWSVVCRVLRLVSNEFGGAIEVLGVSTFFGYAFLDRRTEPVGPASSWMDTRAEPEAHSIAERLGERRIADLTGRRLTGELLLPKLARMANVERERYDRVSLVVGIKDEMVRRLTGVVGTDFAHADYSGGYAPAARAPVEEVWDAAAIDSGLLPRPVSATELGGIVTKEAAIQTGVAEGTPVVRGTSDGSAAMYGCGVMIDGVAAFVSGTTDVLMARSPGGSTRVGEIDPALTVNACMVGDGTIAGGAMGLSGGAAAWVAEVTGTDLAALESAAESLPAGSAGLLMLPSLGGERSPFWNPAVHGAWLGLRPSHGVGHLYRSCLEGSAARVALLLDHLRAAGIPISTLCVGGGGARSRLWNRIRSDATGLRVVVSDDAEATSRGTALLCLPLLHGGRMSESQVAEVTERWLEPTQSFEPDTAAREAYHRARRRYEQAVSMMAAFD